MALGISYCGTAYEGWQSQASGLTVQDRLEAALRSFANQPISTLCAGRTDAGVHALMQIAHFDTDLVRDPYAWVRGTNAHLPSDIAIEWAQFVPGEFHCRASATSRRYSYLLYESSVRPSIDAGKVGWTYFALDHEAMQQAAAQLIGEHDFSSFRASACQALSPIKIMKAIHISRKGALWRFDFEATAFLHHMIRNIMGCLVTIGQQKMPVRWMTEVLDSRNRTKAAPTFSPHGLYFLGPRYEAHWGLPDRTPAFDRLP